MKGIWRTNPLGGAYFPDWKKFTDTKTTRFYVPIMAKNLVTGKYELNTQEMTSEYCKDINSHNIEYAHYSDPSWTSLTDAKEYIGYVVEWKKKCNAISSMLDIEYHLPDFVVECILLYRRAIPTGPLSWTLEPFQGGWFTKELIDVINKDINFVVVVQNFFGGMAPAGLRNNKTPRQELISLGIATNRVKVFYDGAKPLPIKWDGCILSEERLSSSP